LLAENAPTLAENAAEQRNLQRKNLISACTDDDSGRVPRLLGMTPGGPAPNLNASYRRHSDRRSVRTIDSTIDTSRPDPSGA